MNKTMCENGDALTIPAGTQPVLNATMRVYLTVDHPMASETFQGDQRRIYPLAIVNLAEIHAYMNADRTFWVPTEADLSDVGRMRMCQLLDMYPERGGHRITAMIAPHEQHELAPEVQMQMALHTARETSTVN
jgi:hypothetical protein